MWRLSFVPAGFALMNGYSVPKRGPGDGVPNSTTTRGAEPSTDDRSVIRCREPSIVLAALDAKRFGLVTLLSACALWH